MKRYLLLGIAVLMLVVSVQGLTVDFQNPSDFSAQVMCYGAGTCIWTHNPTGGNSGMGSDPATYIISQTPLVMTYSAATLLSTGANIGCDPQLLSATKTVLGGIVSAATTNDRCEVIVAGGTATLYINGVGAGSALVSQNPSFIGWGRGTTAGGTYDDIIWGSTESKYIFGMPENGYFLMKDILNPAASGFYRVNTTSPTGLPTLIASTSMTSTFGKGSGTDETVTLFSQSGGTAQSYQTGTAYAGQISWNLTAIFASDMQYGLVQSTIHDQVPNTAPYVVSDTIPYIGSGATIQFDKNSYAIGETATLSVEMTPSYYAVVTSPHVVIRDIYGTIVYNQPITLAFSSTNYAGTATYTWATTDIEGVYFGSIEATYGGNTVMMNYDTADLNSNLVVTGFVKDAETTSGISGATVNITQGITLNTVTSGADGNYSSTATFAANQPTTLAGAKSGYESYTTTFTPLYAGAIEVNLTLMPTTPTFSGVALGGIARTPPYNRTIDSATITITNANATYSVTTNSAGYYIKNLMPANQLWNIWGTKTGFANSSIYSKLVVGI